MSDPTGQPEEEPALPIRNLQGAGGYVRAPLASLPSWRAYNEIGAARAGETRVRVASETRIEVSMMVDMAGTKFTAEGIVRAW